MDDLLFVGLEELAGRIFEHILCGLISSLLFHLWTTGLIVFMLSIGIFDRFFAGFLSFLRFIEFNGFIRYLWIVSRLCIFPS